MKTYKPAITDSVLAAVALVARRFIGLDGNYCGADLKAHGASELATAAGEQCPVITDGIALVEAGGAITVTVSPVPVTSDSTGRAVAAAVLAAAAPVVDISKLTITSAKLTVNASSTPVTSDAANGAIITAAADAMAAASGLLAAPVLSGSVLPQAVNGWACDVGTFAAGDIIRVKLA